MTTWLLVAVPLAPLLLALLLAVVPRAGSPAIRLAPLAALPALAAVLGRDPVETAPVPWLLIETRVGLDATSQVFLLFSSVLWGAAALYATSYLKSDARRRWFHVFYLLSMSGNFGLIVAQDVVTFYAFFVLMTFPAYGLIIHEGSPFALRAGNIYLVLAFIGELLLLVGLFLAVDAAGSLHLPDIPAAVAASGNRDLIIALLLAAFGIKAGALPLHVWLPLAHPAAPTPASAVLSGAMIKAGLLGWLRFLPLGESALPDWGALVVALGLAAAFYGVVVGLMQDQPKINLAYSSISQMGIMTAGLGLALLEPAAWPLILPATLIYALHHSFAKGALFLSVGLVPAAASQFSRWLLWGSVALAVLALAGAPFTSGFVAKAALKDGLDAAAVTGWVGLLLTLTAAGTTLLMLRFIALLSAATKEAERRPGSPALWASFSVLAAGIVAAAWLVPDWYRLGIDTGAAVKLSKLWDAVWPIALALTIAGAALTLARRRAIPEPRRIPAGDIVCLIEPLPPRMAEAVSSQLAPAAQTVYDRLAAFLAASAPVQVETLRWSDIRLASWRILGIVFTIVFGALVGALAVWGAQ